MGIIAATAVTAAAVGGVNSIVGGIKAKKDAEDAAKARALQFWSEYLEERRRVTKQIRQVEGLSRARIANTGAVHYEGTPRAFVIAQKEEHTRQLAWMKKQAEITYYNIRKGGDSAGALALSQGISAGLSAFGSVASGLGALKESQAVLNPSKNLLTTPHSIGGIYAQ